jgi:hypothetical protein
MTGTARRKSIHIGGFKHVNPIPNACRIGNLVMSGVILGRDSDGKMPNSVMLSLGEKTSKKGPPYDDVIPIART